MPVSRPTTPASTPPLRVLLIEDSLTLRGYLREALEEAGIEVVAEARDGETGIALCEQLRPDAVSLDIVLPGRNGLEVTAEIMARCPTPILIVSASRNRGDEFKTMDALAAGAVDVLDKPPADDADQRVWLRKYCATLRLIAGVRVISRPHRRALASLATAQSSLPAPPRRVSGGAALRLIALATSTGGPAALAQLLPRLPPTFPLPILLVLHIDAAFEDTLCDWLASHCALPLRKIVDGMALPESGEVLLAPAGRHAVLQGQRLRLIDGPERHSCKPAADVLFESLAEDCPRQVMAVVMTGMGQDGARGLMAIRRAGGQTVAQDEASSVIYGMPRAAAELGAAARIVSLSELGDVLLEAAASAP